MNPIYTPPSPISFALEILLDCETIEEAHKKCRKYIKLLEARPKEAAPQVIQAQHPPQGIASNQQAPSTQRLMEAHGMAPPPAPVIPRLQPQGDIDKETGRAIVSTGNGTKGPRKF